MESTRKDRQATMYIAVGIIIGFLIGGFLENQRPKDYHYEFASEYAFQQDYIQYGIMCVALLLCVMVFVLARRYIAREYQNWRKFCIDTFRSI